MDVIDLIGSVNGDRTRTLRLERATSSRIFRVIYVRLDAILCPSMLSKPLIINGLIATL